MLTVDDDEGDSIALNGQWMLCNMAKEPPGAEGWDGFCLLLNFVSVLSL